MREEICLLLEYELLGCVSTCLRFVLYISSIHISHMVQKRKITLDLPKILIIHSLIKVMLTPLDAGP